MSCPITMTSSNEISTELIKPRSRPDPIVDTKIILYDKRFMWTSEHLPPSFLNTWREQGDPMIDCFFATYGDRLEENEDTYRVLEELSNRQESHLCNHFCLDICFINFCKDIRKLPEWFNKQKVERGQVFYVKHQAAALTSTLFYTLIIGYGFQQLNGILLKTQYLLSPDLSDTYRRLMETLQMIVNATCGDVNNFDETFLDVIRVRLLHGMIRYKIKKHTLFHEKEVPINQEDLFITLLGFSYGVLYCIEERIGVSISSEEKESYLHLWRYIGWLIGVKEEYLYYLTSYELARIISESIFYHFYFPSQISKHFVYHTLVAAYVHSPSIVSLKFCIGISRNLLGQEISNALGIGEPKLDKLHDIALAILFKLYRFFAALKSINMPNFNKWFVENSKRRLRSFLHTSLNNQMRNFSLYKTYKPNVYQQERRTMKDCPCGFYERSRYGIMKTHDILVFRRLNTLPNTFMLFLYACLLSIFVLFMYM